MVTLAVHILIFFLLVLAGTVLMWKYRFRLSRMACKQIQKPTKEDENQPLRELPYAWIILIVFVVISTLEMYFDMPSIGMAGLIWKGILVAPALPISVSAFVFVILTNSVRPNRKIVYIITTAFFVLMGFTSSSTALSGIEDLIRGPVTKELILEQVMYEKTWSRGSGRYSSLFPSQSSGRFNIMMSDGKGKYVHFSVSPQDEAFLDEMTKGLTLHNNPVKVEKLRQSVEEKHKSFAMYQGDGFDNCKEVRYKVTYYPESSVLIQTERIDDTY